MQTLIIDCETTGTGDDAQVIEFAACTIDIPACSKVEKSIYQRYKPSVPMQWGAIATHHIWPQDLEGKPPSSEAKLPEGVEYVIGHKVDFDWKMLGADPSIKRICTQAMSRKLFPEADSHTQGAMIAMLCGGDDAIRGLLRGSHSAATDTLLCSYLLRKLIETIQDRYQKPVRDVEHLWQISEWARVPTILSFGKHKGTPIKEVPSDYKAWLLKQDDLDPYLRKALTA